MRTQVKLIIIATFIVSNNMLVHSWWQPEVGTTWQWQINSGDIDDSYDVDMYDVDLFDISQSTISSLKSQGRKVICYFSAGSSEDWRDDYDDLKDIRGNKLEGWDGENWLDITRWDILETVMGNRLDLAVSKGCDGVEPDNVDGYQNDNGLDLTYNDQITYNKNIADLAHSKNLSVGLKNDLDQIGDLIDYFDFAVNEECNGYDECDTLNAFIDTNKAVFGVEYELQVTQFCAARNAAKMDFLAKNWDLDACVYACRDFPCQSTPSCLTDIPESYQGECSSYDEDDGTGNIVIIVSVIWSILFVFICQ